MSNIQEFETKQYGFFPYMKTQSWQVAILNFLDTQDLLSIDKVEVHRNTDEVFLLSHGSATLVTVDIVETQTKNWHCVSMEHGVIYNVPCGVWHNISMSKDAKVFIVENIDTHKNDVCYHCLTQEEQLALQQCIQKEGT